MNRKLDDDIEPRKKRSALSNIYRQCAVSHFYFVNLYNINHGRTFLTHIKSIVRMASL